MAQLARLKGRVDALEAIIQGVRREPFLALAAPVTEAPDDGDTPES
jgi:hypothetical protein